MINNKYSPDNFTYGCELEFADVYRFNNLPEGCNWNTKDYSIVNSNGISNDPLGKLWKYGGEINTKPTNTIEEQIELIRKIIEMLNPPPVINYKCNLHIHIGIPNLEKDLEACKKLFNYIQLNAEEAFKITDPIEKPSPMNYPTEEYKGAIKRYNRTCVSHHHILNKKIENRVMATKTIEEFMQAHINTSETGKLLWHFSPRAGINMRQLLETKTIEFRHFYGTLNLEEYKSCFLWCKEFINAGISTNESLKDITKKYNFLFPKPKKYEHRLHLMWEKTTRGKNKEKDIIKTINEIINKNN